MANQQPAQPMTEQMTAPAAAPAQAAVAAPTPTPTPAPVPAEFCRLRFARREPAIWLAHLDMMRTFERSIRRANLPIAWSHGFNPRPQMMFALPIGVGMATEDDYVDLELTAAIDPAELVARLNQNLPAGLTIRAARMVPAAGPSLMSLVRAAEYELVTPGLADAVKCLDDHEVLTVSKFSKGRQIVVDIRPLILDVTILAADRLLIRVKAGSSANLRPDLFLAALTTYCGLDATAADDCLLIRRRLLVADLRNPASLASPLPLAGEEIVNFSSNHG